MNSNQSRVSTLSERLDAIAQSLPAKPRFPFELMLVSELDIFCHIYQLGKIGLEPPQCLLAAGAAAARKAVERFNAGMTAAQVEAIIDHDRDLNSLFTRSDYNIEMYARLSESDRRRVEAVYGPPPCPHFIYSAD